MNAKKSQQQYLEGGGEGRVGQRKALHSYGL